MPSWAKRPGRPGTFQRGSVVAEDPLARFVWLPQEPWEEAHPVDLRSLWDRDSCGLTKGREEVGEVHEVLTDGWGGALRPPRDHRHVGPVGIHAGLAAHDVEPFRTGALPAGRDPTIRAVVSDEDHERLSSSALAGGGVEDPSDERVHVAHHGRESGLGALDGPIDSWRQHEGRVGQDHGVVEKEGSLSLFLEQGDGAVTEDVGTEGSGGAPESRLRYPAAGPHSGSRGASRCSTGTTRRSRAGRGAAGRRRRK